MRILICGAINSSRTLLAEKLTEEISSNYPVEYITDQLYEQAKEKANAASDRNIVAVCELDCASKWQREDFNADIIVWIDSGSSAQFEELTKSEYDFRIAETEDMIKWSKTLADLIWILE